MIVRKTYLAALLVAALLGGFAASAEAQGIRRVIRYDEPEFDDGGEAQLRVTHRRLAWFLGGTWSTWGGKGEGGADLVLISGRKLFRSYSKFAPSIAAHLRGTVDYPGDFMTFGRSDGGVDFGRTQAALTGCFPSIEWGGITSASGWRTFGNRVFVRPCATYMLRSADYNRDQDTHFSEFSVESGQSFNIKRWWGEWPQDIAYWQSGFRYAWPTPAFPESSRPGQMVWMPGPEKGDSTLLYNWRGQDVLSAFGRFLINLPLGDHWSVKPGIGGSYYDQQHEEGEPDRGVCRLVVPLYTTWTPNRHFSSTLEANMTKPIDECSSRPDELLSGTSYKVAFWVAAKVGPGRRTRR